MSAAHEQLIDATLQHLQDLKARGVRFVNVAPETLTALRQAPPVPARSITRTAAQPVAATQRTTSVFSPPTPAPSANPATIATPTAPRGGDGSSPPDLRGRAVPTPPDPAKAEAMKELRERALVCVKCPSLASARTNVVFGVGSIDAELMFVGEAPGADEDAQGEPFVGAAGQLLTKIIQTMGLTRDTVYIANILKCRPDTPGQASGNRKPTADEMQTCIPYLHSQIDLIKPKVLVALGGTAIEGLLGQAGGITRLRGNWRTYRDIPLMPTFHPAYLLRNQSLAEKRKVWEDMLQVMEKIGLPISEKQRAFFLPR